MLLRGKNALVYGGGGSIGGAVARAFAREGASVFLAGRTLANLDKVAADIAAAGGAADTAQVDAHDPEAVEAHVEEVARKAGTIDVCFNAVGLNDVQDMPLVEMSLQDFITPVTEAARTHFLTATAAARRMTAQGSGVIVMLSSSAARESGFEMGGFSLACAAIECLTRSLAGEVGRHGVRVVALRPNLIPETHPEISESHPQAVQALAEGTALGRLSRLAEVADTAAFVASDHAGAMTGAVVNLTCGAIVD
ncbi:MAG: SDR family oxidoreductase [Nitriliruptorales bacterium]|nr:SDR family oxidoreductase [Nitriliruptorales bacterium]